jgi:hypothetical protein
VERYDEAGNRVLLVPVEMRAVTFEGSLSDGDWVRAHGKVRAGTFRATEVENLTTGATVRGKVPSRIVTVIFTVLFFLLFFAVLAWVGYGFYQGLTGGFE